MRDVDTSMLDLLPQARSFAFAPISGFLVGATVQGGSGALYLGANLEVPGQALVLTMHAEQAALANAYTAGEESVVAIAVTAAPCGHCRQFLKEFVGEGDIRVLVGGGPAVRLSDLLPASFGPTDLGLHQGALPVRETELSLAAPSTDALVLAALNAARRSHAPYTSSHSGLALIAQGRVFAGSYIENAAFNPSLSPLQVALAGLLVSGGKLSDVTRVVLVEAEGAKIRQGSATRAALSSLVPGVELEIIPIR